MIVDKIEVELQIRPLEECEVEDICKRFVGWPMHPLTQLALEEQIFDLISSKVEVFTVVAPA